MSDAHRSMIVPEWTHGPIVAYKIDTRIEAANFELDVFPVMDDIIAKYGKVRIISHFAHYQGWAPEATERDFEFVERYGRNVERFAFINPPHTLMTLYTIRRPLLSGEVRFFNLSDLDEAVAWVREGVETP